MKNTIIKMFNLEPTAIRHAELITEGNVDVYAGRRLSNGPAESVNSRIKLIKSTGNGYRNFERFKLRALYSLNDGSSIKF